MTMPRIVALRMAPGVLTCASAAIAAPFAQTLSFQSVTFSAKARGEGSTQDLVVAAKAGAVSYPAIKEQLDGSVTAAEVEDLNSDGPLNWC